MFAAGKQLFFPLELGIGAISYSLKDKHTTDLRPASVLIFQRQGDGGAGGQLDKMKTMKKVVNRVAIGKSDGDDEEGDGSGEDDGKPLNGDDGEGEAGKLAQDETHPKLKVHLIEKHCTRHNEPRH